MKISGNLYLCKEKFIIFELQSTKVFIMKNLRKLPKKELKTIQGGRPPLGCNDWNQLKGCCRSWDEGYCGNTTCPDSPPPLC